jgi:hypothetical protein
MPVLLMLPELLLHQIIAKYQLDIKITSVFKTIYIDYPASAAAIVKFMKQGIWKKVNRFLSKGVGIITAVEYI